MTPVSPCVFCDNDVELRRYTQFPSIVETFRSSYMPAKPPGLSSVIAGAEAHLHRLETVFQEEREAIERFIAEHRSFAAPIRRIPAEVLLLIFQGCCDLPWYNWALPAELHIVRAAKTTVSLAPYKLATVCKFWRELVISSPRLWSSMIIDLDDIDHKTVEILQMALRRSGEELLYVSLVKKKQGIDQECQAALVQNAHRIKHLHVAGGSDLFLDTEISFPNLSSFDFNAEILGKAKFRFPWLASATRLHSIRLCNVAEFATFFADVNKTISSLATSDYRVSHALRVLPRFSASLKTCRIDVDIIDEYMGLADMDLHFTSLTELTLSNNRITRKLFDISWYLTHLCTPSLETLFLDGFSQPIGWSTKSMEIFITRSGIKQRLQVIELRGGIKISDEVMIETMHLVPHLQRLTILEDEGEGMIMTLPLLDRIVAVHEKPFLPGLRVLTLCLHDNPERMDLLLSLLQHRAPAIIHQSTIDIEPLQSLIVKLVTQTGTESVERFEECRKLGTRIHVEVVTIEERRACLDWD